MKHLGVCELFLKKSFKILVDRLSTECKRYNSNSYSSGSPTFYTKHHLRKSLVLQVPPNPYMTSLSNLHKHIYNCKDTVETRSNCIFSHSSEYNSVLQYAVCPCIITNTQLQPAFKYRV